MGDYTASRLIIVYGDAVHEIFRYNFGLYQGFYQYFVRPRWDGIDGAFGVESLHSPAFTLHLSSIRVTFSKEISKIIIIS